MIPAIPLYLFSKIWYSNARFNPTIFLLKKLYSLNERDQSVNHETNEEEGKLLPGYTGGMPPVGRLPERGERSWVDRIDQLIGAAAALRGAQVIAIDAEFAQVRSFTQDPALSNSPRLALLQLAIDGQCFVVDALRLRDLSPLYSIVDNPETSILLHGAGADLHMMSDRDLFVAHYLDLEAASRSIFGQNESSLAGMLQRAFHLRLDKSLQRTDWARRPLPPAMIAYAARDAEVTLALYYWLQEYYPWALHLHDSAYLAIPVAAWIGPLLRGGSSVLPDQSVAEALQQGTIASREQLVQDCQDALQRLVHPMQRHRLLRLIADLSLTQLAPEIEPLLHAPASDERAAAIRALSRLQGDRYSDAIRPLLQDPVHDVRKAAHIALRTPTQKEPRKGWTTPARQADGSRSWTVGEPQESHDSDQDDWKARLRSLLGDE